MGEPVKSKYVNCVFYMFSDFAIITYSGAIVAVLFPIVAYCGPIEALKLVMMMTCQALIWITLDSLGCL